MLADMSRRPRREFLKYIGIGTVVGLAGCSESGDSSDGGDGAESGDGETADEDGETDTESATDSGDGGVGETEADEESTTGEDDETDAESGTDSDAGGMEETEADEESTTSENDDRFPQYEVIEDSGERDERLPWLNAYIGFRDPMGEVAVNEAETVTVVGWSSQINEGEARNLADAEDSFTVQVTVRNDGDEEVEVGGRFDDYEVEVFPYVSDEQIDPSLSDTTTPGSLVPDQWGNFVTELHPDTEPAEFDRYEIHITE